MPPATPSREREQVARSTKQDASWFSPQRLSPKRLLFGGAGGGRGLEEAVPSGGGAAAVAADPFHLLQEGRSRAPSSSSEAAAQQQQQEEEQDALLLADRAERGVSREITTKFTAPAREWQRTLIVQSEQQPLEYRLYSAAYDFLLFARASADKQRVNIFGSDPASEEGEAGDSGDPFAAEPAFTLICNGKGHWELVRQRCERCHLSPKHTFCACSGKQRLAYVRHSSKKLGNGVCNVLDVSIPALDEEGSPKIWCPLQDQDGSSPQSRSKDNSLTLGTNCPIWNDEFQCLVLEFVGRTVTPSPGNFQLILQGREGDDDDPQLACQHGKIGPWTSSLDFGPPLGVAQAFGLALSTIQLT